MTPVPTATFCAACRLGGHAREQDVLGIIRDPSSSLEIPVIASCDGLIIGRSELPLVHEGEALFHIAQVVQPA